MSEEQLTQAQGERLGQRAREALSGHAFQAHPHNEDDFIADTATLAFAVDHLLEVGSDPDMPAFTRSILKIVADSLRGVTEFVDKHPLAHLGVEGLRKLAEAEKDARVELERQLIVAREHNKATQALLDRERDQGSDLRLHIKNLQESLKQVVSEAKEWLKSAQAEKQKLVDDKKEVESALAIAVGNDPAVPFLAEAWRTAFVAAFELERQKQPQAATTTIATNAAFAANKAVLQSCCPDDDTSPMGLLIGRGLA